MSYKIYKYLGIACLVGASFFTFLINNNIPANSFATSDIAHLIMISVLAVMFTLVGITLIFCEVIIRTMKEQVGDKILEYIDSNIKVK